MRPVVVQYTKLWGGLRSFAHLRSEGGVGFVQGSGKMFLRPGLPTCYLGCQAPRSLACAWGRVGELRQGEVDAARALWSRMRRCGCWRCFAASQFAHLVSGYAGGAGLWFIGPTPSKNRLHLAKPPGGLEHDPPALLSPPPEEPAFAPQLGDACVSAVWPSHRPGERGWGRGGVFLSQRKSSPSLPCRHHCHHY